MRGSNKSGVGQGAHTARAEEDQSQEPISHSGSPKCTARTHALQPSPAAALAGSWIRRGIRS